MGISGALYISAALLVVADAVAATGVDMKDARRVVGTEGGIRVDAQIMTGAQIGSIARVVFEVENLGEEPIAVADLAADTDYDSASRTVTVNLGSEIPSSHPTRLVRIDPHQKKSFVKGAPLKRLVAGAAARVRETPRYIRVKLNFLTNLAPFQALFGAASVPSDDLFATWVDHNDTIITNSVPIEIPTPQSDESYSAERGAFGDRH